MKKKRNNKPLTFAITGALLVVGTVVGGAGCEKNFKTVNAEPVEEVRTNTGPTTPPPEEDKDKELEKDVKKADPSKKGGENEAPDEGSPEDKQE